MKNFLSSKNTFTITILWSVVFILLLLLAYGINSGEVEFVAIVILSLVISLIIWILLDTRYVIKKGLLLYRSGPFRGRIYIDRIQKIQRYSGLFVPVTTKPALDSNGYIISYNNYDALFVSPKSGDIFLEEILKINPAIEVI